MAFFDTQSPGSKHEQPQRELSLSHTLELDKWEVTLKPLRLVVFLFLSVIAFTFLVSAQENSQSLGDIARQERARKEAQFDANEIAGLKEGDFHANILITDSKDSVEKWVLMPAADRPGAGRFREVTRDKKFYVPFVVTEYAFPASEKMELNAHIRFISPTGKTLFDAPHISGAERPDPRSPHTIVLNPVMDLTFDSKDVPGTYTLRVTITDHAHSTYAKAEEKFQLLDGTTARGDLGKSPTVVPTSGTR